MIFKSKLMFGENTHFGLRVPFIPILPHPHPLSRLLPDIQRNTFLSAQFIYKIFFISC